MQAHHMARQHLHQARIQSLPQEVIPLDHVTHVGASPLSSESLSFSFGVCSLRVRRVFQTTKADSMLETLHK